MKSYFFFFLLLAFSIVGLAQNKKPLSVSLELNTHVFNPVGKPQRIQIGNIVAYPAKKAPFQDPMYGLTIILRKPLRKNLSIGLDAGVSIVRHDIDSRGYLDDKYLVVYPMTFDVQYRFKKQWKLLVPIISVNIGYVKSHYLLILNSENSLDRYGGMSYGAKVGFSIENRKFKKLAPFRFMIGYRNYYENVHASIHYIPSAGLENIDFDFKTLRESMSFVIQYQIPFKKKKNKKEN